MVLPVMCEANNHPTFDIFMPLGERYAFRHARTEGVAVDSSDIRKTAIPCKRDVAEKERELYVCMLRVF